MPLILDAVGTAGYGVWTLGLALILYASILETGLGPAVQRFTAFARGRGDAALGPARAGRRCALYAALGASAGSRSRLLAPRSSTSSTCPPAAADAETMFRVLGGALALALLAAGLGNLLQGLERFGALAVSGGAGALAFLAAIVALAGAEGLPGLARRGVHRPGGRVTARAVALRGVAFGRPSRLVGARELPSASWASRRACRSPCSSELVNWQSDKLVVGLVARGDRRPARHRRLSSPTAARCARRRRAVPRPVRRSRSRRARATTPACGGASASCTACGCSACSAPE